MAKAFIFNPKNYTIDTLREIVKEYTACSKYRESSPDMKARSKATVKVAKAELRRRGTR